MKTITFKKSWVEKIEKLDKSLQDEAVLALYKSLKTENFWHDDDTIGNFLTEIKWERARQAKAREKARERREMKKKAAQEARSNVESSALEVVENELDGYTNYKQYPELYMFDGFMSFLISRGGQKFRPEVPEGYNYVELFCYFRDWVIQNNKVKEINKLSSFCGLFRHALPTLIKSAA